MKAAVYAKYGPPEVLQLREVAKPVPKNNEILIEIFATSVTKFDCWTRSCTAPPGFRLLSRIASGIRKPKKQILGTELAGEIESVGKDVKLFMTGDQVFASTGMGLGSNAEYLCMPEDGPVAPKPVNMTYEQAACVPQGSLTALYFLRKANIRRGQKVLIFGASGGVGTAAVQLAKYFGADVTGVCSTSKVDLVKSLGADRVVDYMKEDLAAGDPAFDIIFDTVGKSPISDFKRLLDKEGRYLFATFGLPRLFQMIWFSITSSKKAIFGVLKETSEDLVFLKELIENEKIKSVIDRSFPLDQAAEAHGYVEAGHKKGNVVLTVAHGDKK
jgi:NADPH:quinone reductase-like Zn-dependent oxidoreductase